GVAEAVYYNGYRGGVDLVGPSADARGDGAGHACFAHHLGLEHMAFHGVQGRGVLVEPGDMLLLHTGFATKVLEWNKEPDPVKIHRMCAALDPRDESLLEWIAESRISALIADNYAVEAMLGGSPLVDGKRTLLPIHHLCLFKLGVPLGEMWYLHE